MRVLFVGDPHVQKSNLDESKKLVEWIKLERESLRPDIVLLAGDLYNDFGVKRVEVDEFWTDALSTILPGAVVLEGNHDQTPDGEDSALSAHRDRCFLVQRATMYAQNVGMLPFIRKNEDFLEACRYLYVQGARIIFCHADVNGAQYENGFYSPHGADITGLPQDLQLISGHIHKQQKFGNVWFPGTPRHLNRSDVGEKKGIWLIDTTTSTTQFLETPPEVAQPFQEFVITPDTAHLAEALPATSRVYVDVHGPKEFVSKILEKLPESNKVRTFVETIASPTDISEADGIPKAFLKYAARYASEKSLPPEVAQKVLEKVYARCPSLRIST